MSKASTRKQTQGVLKPCLESLEKREQPSSLSVGNVLSTVFGGVTAVEGQISQMEQNFLSSLKNPQFHIAADAAFVTVGLATAQYGKTLPPPGGAFVSFAGYVVASIATVDFVKNVLHYQGPSLLQLAFGVASPSGGQGGSGSPTGHAASGSHLTYASPQIALGAGNGSGTAMFVGSGALTLGK